MQRNCSQSCMIVNLRKRKLLPSVKLQIFYYFLSSISHTGASFRKDESRPVYLIMVKENRGISSDDTQGQSQSVKRLV